MSSNEEGSHPAGWRKARRSMGNGECVEVLPVNARILVRDSKNPGSSIISYSADAWQSFVSGAKRGEFDLPAS